MKGSEKTTPVLKEEFNNGNFSSTCLLKAVMLLYIGTCIE